MSFDQRIERGFTKDMYLPFIIQTIQASGNDSINDLLLMRTLDLLLHYFPINYYSVEKILDAKPVTEYSFDENYLIKSYYQYFWDDKCIVNEAKQLIEHKYFADKAKLQRFKNIVISLLGTYFEAAGYYLQIINQINNREYNFIYNKLASRFNFNDDEIHSFINEWGNLTTNYVIVKKDEPGKHLGYKLASQSSYNRHELFFIKVLVNTFCFSKNNLLYKESGGEISVDVEAIKQDNEYYLIPVYKVLKNLNILANKTFEEFVDALKSKEEEMPSLELYSYSFEEIEQSYKNQYEEFQKQELENETQIDENTVKEEIHQLNKSVLRAILEQLIQQNWLYTDPSQQYRPTLKFQLEFEKYYNGIGCQLCKRNVISHQGLVCKSCKECSICLDCSYSFLERNKSGLNRKDSSIVDGQWCPGCSEPWRNTKDIILVI